MERTVLSAEELRKKVEKLVNAIDEIADDDARVVTPMPQLQEVDRDGCNWDMGSFKGGADYETEIREAVEHVREKYNLAHK
jgi:hypothetical protein